MQKSFKKFSIWLKRKITRHPIITGLILFYWLRGLITITFSINWSYKDYVILSILAIFSWALFLFLSTIFKEKRIKWYFRKWLVLLFLVFMPPLGIILLWMGTRFSRPAKIGLTVFFGIAFLTSPLIIKKSYYKLVSRPTVDRIYEIINQPKRTTYLAALSKSILKEARINVLNERHRRELKAPEIIRQFNKSIVAINTFDRDSQQLGLGSGFIIDPNGFIVTNFHVIQDAYSANIKIDDKVHKNVFLIKGMPEHDMAILKIDTKDASALVIGDSDKIEAGEKVFAIGNPIGLELSISEGIISAIRIKGKMKLFQITAPLSPGNSGGPIFNKFGEVIGIATLASWGFVQNINFAIPINYLKDIISNRAFVKNIDK